MALSLIIAQLPGTCQWLGEVRTTIRHEAFINIAANRMFAVLMLSFSHYVPYGPSPLFPFITQYHGLTLRYVRVRTTTGMHSTLRAAAKQLSELLRIKLGPLDVRAVTAIIGVIDTPIFTNSHPDGFQLPPGPYHELVRLLIVGACEGKLQPPMTHRCGGPTATK